MSGAHPSSSTPPAPTPTLHEREFDLLRALVEHEAGISLSPAKRELMVSRLARRLRALGLNSFWRYYELVASPEGADERVRMLDAMTTNETRFFREPAQFHFLEQQLLPTWRSQAAAGQRPRVVRAWSAGCSTGEEPYSLAMVLLRHLPLSEGWRHEILATDLCTQVLDRAREGQWPVARADEIPGEYRRAFMLRGVREHEGTMKVGAELRAIVSFQRLNLHQDDYPAPRDCDLVFCRNVLIYFDQTTRRQITDRLIGHLRPGGFLFLGHAENLQSTVEMARVIPTVHQRPWA